MARRRYSPGEQKMIEILNGLDGKRATSKEIVALRYKNGDAPENARQSVVTVLTKLAGKVKRNREKFRIRKSERRGPYPIEFWIE